MKKKFVFFCTGMSGVAGLLLARSHAERNSLRTEVYQISTKGRCCRHRFVFLTDLHEKCFGKDNARLLAHIRAAKPEAILIGGDSIVSRHGFQGEDRVETTVRLLGQLKQHYPVYYAFGNHEQRLFDKAASAPPEDAALLQGYRRAKKKAKQLRAALSGVTVLDNRTVLHGDVSISGIGLSERFFEKQLFGKKEPLTAEELREKTGALSGGFHIFLLHSPLYLKEAAQAGASLVLSGHFHGGTIRLPFLGGVMTPQYHFFLPECAGEFHKGDATMVVGRGLGTHSVNIRLNNRPQICVIDLV